MDFALGILFPIRRVRAAAIDPDLPRRHAIGVFSRPGSELVNTQGAIIMSYTLEQLAADCRDALATDPGPAGREQVRRAVARACSDEEFVAMHLGPDNTTERKILYQDPDMGFCILAHVYQGAKASDPHDHASTWAIYGQAAGVTMMVDWRAVEKPRGGQPGKAERVRAYKLEPGDAHVYQEGDLHSPERDGPTRLIRIEGKNMDGVKRDKYVPV
jgi:hypothetical protein